MLADRVGRRLEESDQARAAVGRRLVGRLLLAGTKEKLKFHLMNATRQDRYATTMVIRGFKERATKNDAIAWTEDKITQICKFSSLDCYCKGDEYAQREAACKV